VRDCVLLCSLPIQPIPSPLTKPKPPLTSPADTSSSYLPVHFTSLKATLFDLTTTKVIARGDYGNQKVPKGNQVPIVLPVQFLYAALNTSDTTCQSFRWPPELELIPRERHVRRVRPSLAGDYPARLEVPVGTAHVDRRSSHQAILPDSNQRRDLPVRAAHGQRMTSHSIEHSSADRLKDNFLDIAAICIHLIIT
jgi:hypothetical protein